MEKLKAFRLDFFEKAVEEALREALYRDNDIVVRKPWTTTVRELSTRTQGQT